MRKIICSLSLFFLVQTFLYAQDFGDSISEKETSAALNFLSSDKLKGRGNFTPELITAGNFIIDKFIEYGLEPFPGSFNFYQPFNGKETRTVYRDQISWNARKLDQSKFFYLSSELFPERQTLKDFNVVTYDGIFNDSIYLAHWVDKTNTLVWLKQPQPDNWQVLIDGFRNPGFPPSKKILFVTDSKYPSSLSITTNPDFKSDVLFNVIGMLPGKTKPNEIVIFSAHYDHIGSLMSNDGDGIYNGANDDASGTTALLMLAKYFAMRNDNDRTIFFCAFAGEEVGLLGSSFLASKLKPENIVAMINIEMIGKTNVTGENSFFLTGARYSSLEKIMKANLKDYPFKIHYDPEKGNLFQRSDNFSFAMKGVPAHTVMCSDDKDSCYHQTCDEAKDINIENMVRVIKAIVVSTSTIITGRDTPTRVRQ